MPLPKGELERSCWQRHTRERTRPNIKEATLVEFSNLRHRDRVRSPFMVEFAVRGMGVVPAGKAMAGTGHHHILINTPLPLNIGEKIPFSDTHKHFGKGQTFAVLDLPTGRHTLRLLFADHDHRPYFVYSREITIDVIGRRNSIAPVINPDRFDETCAEWYQDELSRPRPPGEWVTVSNLRDGEPVASPFSLHFGVEGYGVCAVGVGAERTGHFKYEVYREKQMVQQADLGNGATQATLSLPNGTYTFRLRFVDATGQRDLLPAQDLSLVVNAQNRL
ncbi:DUF4399 domain-containing protein [Ideonella sp. A 288]|uniref:DUF4399 domain-containing protein n=1 Tax=Ideonella sp. A 288 TaxID=1962181 RepID=UPI0013039781|nr:DUF4399 domain-containing protein [Ideonella sp. A 288]